MYRAPVISTHLPVSFPFSPSLLPSLLIVLIILFPYRSKFSEPNNKQ